MPDSYELYIIRCCFSDHVRPEGLWMFAILPFQRSRASVYYYDANSTSLADTDSKGLVSMKMKLPSVVGHGLLLSKTLISTVTKPHMLDAAGRNRCESIVSRATGITNKQYIVEILQALERASLVRDGTWASWKSILGVIEEHTSSSSSEGGDDSPQRVASSVPGPGRLLSGGSGGADPSAWRHGRGGIAARARGSGAKKCAGQGAAAASVEKSGRIAARKYATPATRVVPINVMGSVGSPVPASVPDPLPSGSPARPDPAHPVRKSPLEQAAPAPSLPATAHSPPPDTTTSHPSSVPPGQTPPPPPQLKAQTAHPSKRARTPPPARSAPCPGAAPGAPAPVPLRARAPLGCSDPSSSASSADVDLSHEQESAGSDFRPFPDDATSWRRRRRRTTTTTTTKESRESEREERRWIKWDDLG